MRGQDQKIRILRIIARLNIGGPAIQAINLTKAFSSNEYDSLLVCGRVSSHEGDMSYLAKESGVSPIYLPQLSREISPINDLISFLRIRDIIRTYRPHIIHTHTAKAGALGRLSAFSLRGIIPKPVLIHTFHGHVFRGYFSPIKGSLFLQIERALARISSRIIVISPKQKDEICYKYRVSTPDKVKIIPLGFDLLPFESKHSESKEIRDKFIENGRFLIGIVGRLTAIKNHRMFIDAVKILKKRNKLASFRFIIVGDGELKEDIFQRVRESALDGYVKFVGWQKFMPPWYQAMDGIILTSLNEGTPVTIIEAMASGKPVIATDVGGVRDLLGDEIVKEHKRFKITRYGLLVPSNEPEVLADAIIYFKENYSLLKKSFYSAKRFVYERYSIKRLVSDLDRLYKDILYIILR